MKDDGKNEYKDDDRRAAGEKGCEGGGIEFTVSHGPGRRGLASRDPPSLAEPTRSPWGAILVSPLKTVSCIQTKRHFAAAAAAAAAADVAAVDAAAAAAGITAHASVLDSDKSPCCHQPRPIDLPDGHDWRLE